LKVAGFYKPIVCAVRGFCFGGGFEIMLATDIRIACATAEFQLPEPQHGFVAAGGTLVRLVRQIGYAHAMEILLTAKRFTAAEMMAKGVVNQVVAPEDVEPVAQELAARIAGFSPTAIQTIKEAVLTLQDLPLQEAFAAEAKLGQRTFTSPEAREGLAAFANRNPGKARHE
jgi:enoyl-CoA hydratase